MTGMERRIQKEIRDEGKQMKEGKNVKMGYKKLIIDDKIWK